MKKIILINSLISVVLGFLLFSCDDAGQNPVFVQKGKVTFSVNNLRPLDQQVDGLYTLWLAIDSSGNRVWYSLGQFNIGGSGEIVDANGNPMVFTFNGDTNSLVNATKATISVGGLPDKSVLIAASLAQYTDSVTGNLWIQDDLALGSSFGAAILGGNYGKYPLQTPTDNNASCLKGLWLSDVNGNDVWPNVPDLPAGKGWILEGWINDESTNSFYSIGRFFSFRNADNDGAGPCKGPNGNGFNKPGQDWVQTGCL